MKIRFGTIEDLADVQRLSHALTLYEREHVTHNQDINEVWPTQPDGVTYWTGMLKGEGMKSVLLADDGGRIIGFLAASCLTNAHRHLNPVAEIETMFVEASHRGTGVGSLLVEEFKTWALSLGAQRFEVTAWLENHPALGFYRKHGFVEDAVRLALAPKSS